MRIGVAALAALLTAGLLIAEPGGGTTAVPEGKKPTPPAGNPNQVEPGLEDNGWKAYDTTYVPVLKNWTIKAFTGGFAAVSNRGGEQLLALPVKDKGGVAVKGEANAIEVDGNHDGKFDDRLKTDGAACLVTLVYPDGDTAPYAVRFQKGQGGSWSWQRSGYWTATINKTQFGILDNNNNGTYDENGQDAISVGLNGYASPLSRIVSLGGTLYEIKVAASGKKVYVKEWAGDVGKIDATSGHKSYGRLASAVFQSGDLFFDVTTGKDRAFVVPAGTYDFVGGECKMKTGNPSAMMRKGKFQPVTVLKDETAKVTWGAGLVIDFDFDVSGGKVNVFVSSVAVFGQGGEEYYNFNPPAFTPTVMITDKSKGGGGKPAGKGTMCLS